MEPTERKMKILEAVVEAYIKTGDPIGSKAICDVLDFSVSSATVRNDMAELSGLGLLEQPHTSSGRVPTELGYRVYIDDLMKPVPLNKREKTAIKDTLDAKADTPEELLETAADILSRITGCAAIAFSPPGENALIRHVKFVQTGSYTAMAVLITSLGSVKPRLFRCDYMITPSLLDMFDKAINERLAGMPVTAVTPAFIQTAALSFGEMSMIMPNVLLAVSEAAKEASADGTAIKGQSNLFMMPELNSECGKRVMELLGKSRELSKLIAGAEERAGILIGSELKNPALSNLSVVAAHYAAAPNCSGMLAIIGPLRMNYSKMISTIGCVADLVGESLSELLEI
jgi:heat-inducible transcriptional repressor